MERLKDLLDVCLQKHAFRRIHFSVRGLPALAVKDGKQQTSEVMTLKVNANPFANQNM